MMATFEFQVKYNTGWETLSQFTLDTDAWWARANVFDRWREFRRRYRTLRTRAVCNGKAWRQG
jgi:hypothetical protein